MVTSWLHVVTRGYIPANKRDLGAIRTRNTPITQKMQRKPFAWCKPPTAANHQKLLCLRLWVISEPRPLIQMPRVTFEMSSLADDPVIFGAKIKAAFLSF